MLKFCPKCRHPLNGGEKFCPNCQQDLREYQEDNNQPAQSGRNQAPQQVAPRPPKRPMSKKNKIILSIIGALVVVFGIFYAWGSSYYSNSNQVNRILSALKDPKQAGGKYVSCDDPNVKITDSSVKPLQNYYKNHSNQADELKYALTSNAGNSDVQLVQSGHHFLIFPKYTAQFHGYTPKIETNHANSIVKMNGKSIGKLTGSSSHFSKELDPVLPGHYEFSIKSKVAGRTLTANANTNIWSNQNVDLNINTETLVIKSVPNGTVYINDKKVGSLSNKGELTLSDYPITKHMTLYVSGKFGKKELQSKTITDLDEGLENAATDDDSAIISASGKKYVIRPEWKGLASNEEAGHLLSDVFESGGEKSQYVGEAGNSSYLAMKKMFDGFRDDDSVNNFDTDVKIESITPYDTDESQVNYVVTFTFEHDDYTHVQVIEYTGCILKNVDRDFKVDKIGSAHVKQDKKVTGDSDDEDSDTNDDDD